MAGRAKGSEEFVRQVRGRGQGRARVLLLLLLWLVVVQRTKGEGGSGDESGGEGEGGGGDGVKESTRRTREAQRSVVGVRALGREGSRRRGLERQTMGRMEQWSSRCTHTHVAWVKPKRVISTAPARATTSQPRCHVLGCWGGQWSSEQRGHREQREATGSVVLAWPIVRPRAATLGVVQAWGLGRAVPGPG